MKTRVVIALLALALIAVAIAGIVRVRIAPQETSVDHESFADVGPLPERESFLAFARDFEGYRTWERLPLENPMVPTGATPGPTYVYVNRRAPAGAHAWPVGTILVKEIQSGPEDDWVVHAMVKRGAPYNHDGTVGWEFFELDVSHDHAPTISWRGQSPPSGHGYGAAGRDAGVPAEEMVCNDCHGPSWQTDGVLTPALALLPLRSE